MKRVVVLGRGGAGKSTFATRLGALTGLPVTELDNHFWQHGLNPTPKQRWAAIQGELIKPERWILDGDLAQYDILGMRLAAADTVIVLDFPFWRCALRAARRSARTQSSGGGSGTTAAAASRRSWNRSALTQAVPTSTCFEAHAECSNS